jgi:protein kinase-like protein/PEGA domain-containing protein
MTRDDPAAFAPPPAFGPFRVLHQIGIGALGPVFRTYEPTRDRLVAVKVFRLDVTPEQAQSLADELGRAADAGLFHPSIVEPIGAGVEGTVAYRAEEYVAAESLDVAMRHYAPASLDLALPFLTQLAGAIDFARAAGVGHGGLHLRDVFVTPDEARASGFGIVEALERVGVRAPVRRPYSAPERIAGAEWSTPADVFSLAAIGYELLTGRRPAGTGAQIGDVWGEKVAANAAAIKSVLARAMDDEPGRRYPTALAFASALEAAARSGTVDDKTVVAVPAATMQEKSSLLPREAALASITAPVPVAQVPDEQPVHDDIEVERDEDAAHHLLIREADATAPSLFEADEEAAADLALDHAAIAADDSTQWKSKPDPREPDVPALAPGANRFWTGNHEDRGFAPATADPVLTTPAERPRPAILPLAFTAIVCLLIGYTIRDAVGGRQSAPPAGSSTEAPKTTAAPAPSPTDPQQPGRAYSEQAVAPPTAAAPQAGREAPPVPGDAPAADAPARVPKAAAAPASSARLTVLSTPSRAGVTVNGKWRGRTPLTLDALPLGTYTVRVVQPGFAASNEDITLTTRQPMRTVSVHLQPVTARTPAAASGSSSRSAANGRAATAPREAAPQTYAGSIFVDSRPRGATILIDGKPAGTTPASIPDVPIGSHVVRLELTDHRAWTTSTRVTAGEQVRVTGSLERIR